MLTWPITPRVAKGATLLHKASNRHALCLV